MHLHTIYLLHDNTGHYEGRCWVTIYHQRKNKNNSWLCSHSTWNQSIFFPIDFCESRVGPMLFFFFFPLSLPPSLFSHFIFLSHFFLFFFLSLPYFFFMVNILKEKEEVSDPDSLGMTGWYQLPMGLQSCLNDGINFLYGASLHRACLDAVSQSVSLSMSLPVCFISQSHTKGKEGNT